MSFRTPGQSLPANLALATAAFVVFGAVLEGGARLLERCSPPPREEGLIWNWRQGWGGDFYTLESDPSTWPPWRRTNREGLRDRARPEQRAFAEWRVAVLGDSVAFGHGINPREAFPLMKANYYRQMGWDEQTGKLLPETLSALDLEELIPDFWAEAPAAQGLRVGG